MKKETLQEAAERLYPFAFGGIGNSENDKKNHFIKGAKWQAKRMYSEEDMRKAFIAGGNSNITEDDGYGSRYLKYMDKWFEQFKKK
ncbi:MAG: hypothetical protein EBZ95_13980 [Chitinophagia bacterium]|nr:hypothetical protein [Chitinophagia bacterium]